MMRIFYKTVNRTANALGMRRLTSWAYRKWARWWMDADPNMWYWLFAEDYLGERIPRTSDGKIEI